MVSESVYFESSLANRKFGFLLFIDQKISSFSVIYVGMNWKKQILLREIIYGI